VVLYLLLTADTFLSVIQFNIDDFPALGAPIKQISNDLAPTGLTKSCESTGTNASLGILKYGVKFLGGTLYDIILES
jgi:hypothetical protein